MIAVRYIGPIEEIVVLGLSAPYRMRRGEAVLVREEDAERLLEDPAFELVENESPDHTKKTRRVTDGTRD